MKPITEFFCVFFCGQGGGGGGEKPDGGFRVDRWGSPPAKRTLLLFTYLVHAYGHGLQRKQGAELGKRKGGGAKSDMGTKAQV